MSFGKTNPSSEGIVRAIALIALVFIIFGVSCRSKPNPEIRSSPPPIDQHSVSPTDTLLSPSTTSNTASPREILSPTAPATIFHTKKTPTISRVFLSRANHIHCFWLFFPTNDHNSSHSIVRGPLFFFETTILRGT